MTLDAQPTKTKWAFLIIVSRFGILAETNKQKKKNEKKNGVNWQGQQ